MAVTYQIDYLEFPSKDGLKTRRFFEEAFDWSFVSYGPTYHVIEAAGIDAGIDGDAGRRPARLCPSCVPPIWRPRSAPSNLPAASSPVLPSIFRAVVGFISASRAAAKWRSGFPCHELRGIADWRSAGLDGRLSK